MRPTSLSRADLLLEVSEGAATADVYLDADCAWGEQCGRACLDACLASAGAPDAECSSGAPCPLDVSALLPWSDTAPHLHTATVRLRGVDDAIVVRFGVRTVAAAGGQVLLNGRPLRLVGFNRHDASEGHRPPAELERAAVFSQNAPYFTEISRKYSGALHYPTARASKAPIALLLHVSFVSVRKAPDAGLLSLSERAVAVGPPWRSASWVLEHLERITAVRAAAWSFTGL